MRPRIGIDLDYTLGEVVVHHLSNQVVGFTIRPGCVELLTRLQSRFTLCLWTISSRWYLDAALTFGLQSFFEETYAGDEIICDWKDIRRINVEFLIDDSVWHRDHAAAEKLDVSRYIVVPAFGSEEDRKDPLLWACWVDKMLHGY